MGGEKILHRAATGVADIEKNQPMAADSVFWIVSMTKPITATAVMMMQDEGKLSVDDPVKHRIYLMMIQRADLANGNACDIRRDFQNAATNP